MQESDENRKGHPDQELPDSKENQDNVEYPGEPSSDLEEQRKRNYDRFIGDEDDIIILPGEGNK